MQENVINFLTFFTIHSSLLEILSKQYAYERPTEFKILFVCKSDHETITKKKCQGPKRQKMSWTVWMMGMQVYITLHNFFQEKNYSHQFFLAYDVHNNKRRSPRSPSSQICWEWCRGAIKNMCIMKSWKKLMQFFREQNETASERYISELQNMKNRWSHIIFLQSKVFQ